MIFHLIELSVGANLAQPVVVVTIGVVALSCRRRLYESLVWSFVVKEYWLRIVVWNSCKLRAEERFALSVVLLTTRVAHVRSRATGTAPH